jgi:hypothetical protein
MKKAVVKKVRKITLTDVALQMIALQRQMALVIQLLNEHFNMSPYEQTHKQKT